MNEMNSSFLDLMYAKECLDQYVDLSLSDMFFEETDEIKETNKNNDSLISKATNAIGSAIKKLIDMIKSCIDKVKEFISTRFMSKEQRAKYQQLKKMAMSDASLANKPVTIANFAPYADIYDNGIDQLNKLEKSGNITDESVNSILGSVSDKINNVKQTAKGVATRTTLKEAIKIAEKDMLVAHGLNSALNSELISLEDLVGDNDAVRYKNNASVSRRRALLHRVKCGLLRKKQDTVLDCLKSQTKTILSNFTELSKSDANREYVTKNGKVKKRVISADSMLHGVGKFSSDINEISGRRDTADKIAYKLARKTQNGKKAVRRYKTDKAISNAKRAFSID